MPGARRAGRDLITVEIAQPLRQQQCRRLRQVGVEQFVQFVPGIEPGQAGGKQPYQGDHRQHRSDQAALQ